MSQALRRTICPYTVLLFEPRFSQPALRVIQNNFLFRNAYFFDDLNEIFDKNFQKNEFSKIFEFVIFFGSRVQPLSGF